MSTDPPPPFTEAQRALFKRVAELNRARPEAFDEADRWIRTRRPVTALQKRRQYIRQTLDEIRRRRRRGDRSWLVAPSGRFGHDWRKWAPKDEKEKAQKAAVLAQWRKDRAGRIRHARALIDEDIKREAERGPLRPDERIEFVARELRDLDFDQMDRATKRKWALRAVRVVWVLTDTENLNGCAVSWARDWPWGEYVPGVTSDDLLFRSTASPRRRSEAPFRPPRLYARMEILDTDRVWWEDMTRRAFEAIEEVAPAILPGRVTESEPRPSTPLAAARVPGMVAVGSPTRVPVESSARPKIARNEANVKARDYLREHPSATARELAAGIGCSSGLVSKLPAWQAVSEERSKGRQPKKSGVVSLTPRLERTAGTEDESLQKLIDEQKADAEPSPLQDDSPSYRPGAPRKAKVYRKR